jgi:hypothetical protein
MATISGANNEKIFSLKKWGGLNEAPDGDTRLKLGEASEMVNWKITRDGNLKRRPGTEFVAGLCTEYTISISPDIQELCMVQPDDTFGIYHGLSATANPGKVTLFGTGAAIEQGVMTSYTAEIRNGALNYSDPETASIEDGVLSIENSYEEMTRETLQEALDALEPGEYLYILYDELPYALNANCIYSDGTNDFLGGYIITSKPVTASPVQGLWHGLVQGKEMLLAACNGKVWSLYDADRDVIIREPLGNIDTSGKVTFFPFGGNVYILDGDDYYVYDGTLLSVVDGYIPIVAKQLSPTSGETTGEYVNLLIPNRRVWISPDGTNRTFTMPEKPMVWDNTCYVRDLSTGEIVPPSDYSHNQNTAVISFYTAPARGVNTYEICYKGMSVADYAPFREQVTHNRFAEIFSGPTDNMVFLYGDGTNRAVYSGMDDDGMPRADYFPDQYEVHVGDSNTPITAMVRHYGDLVCYKPDSTWAITQSAMELASGDNTIGIYCTPVNRDKGNVAPGQVRLVDNNPVTCSERELYHWINSSYYTSTLSRDERQARRISDRIQRSIKEIDLTKCCMWDDNDGQEFYLSQNKVTLVWNYATDTWYRYEGIDAVCMCNFHGEVIYGTSEGLLARITYNAAGDMGHPILARWISGAIDFGAANMRKYSSSMWVGLKPEEGTSVNVELITDRKNTFKEKIVSSEKAKVRGQPFMVKTKLKAKKFVFYRLLLTVDDKQPAVTVTDVEFRVRQTGYAK